MAQRQPPDLFAGPDTALLAARRAAVLDPGVGRGASTRKPMEAALKETERVKSELLDLLNAAQAIAQIGSWEWDLRTHHVWWSQETYRIFGTTPQDFVPSFEANRQFIHPEDVAAYGKAFEHSLQTGELLDLDVRLVTRAGQVKFCNAKGKVIRDDSGQPIRFVGTILDITGRKRAEEELREGEARLRLAVEASNIGLWDWDLRTNTVYFSPEWKRQIGYRDDEISDRFDEWECRVHPDDLEPTLQKVRAFLADSQGRHDVEFRFRHKDGSYRWIYTRAAVLRDAAGDPARMLGCHIDLTERKQAETALREKDVMLRQMSAMAQIGAWEFEAATGRGSWTEEIARIYDLDPAVETNVELGLSFFHGEWRGKIESAVKDAVERGQPYDLELELVTAKGNRKWVRTIGLPLKLGDRVIKVRGTMQDITARKQAEAALREQLDELRRWQAVMLDREERHLALKREVNDLCRRLGEPPRYPSQEASAATDGRSG